MRKNKKKCKVFEYGQFWKINYTETRLDGQKFNFNTIIYSRSKNFALEILEKKTDEDNPGSEVSHIDIDRITSRSKIKDRKLSIVDWGHIRNASFPNEVNILFKK